LAKRKKWETRMVSGHGVFVGIRFTDKHEPRALWIGVEIAIEIVKLPEIDFDSDFDWHRGSMGMRFELHGTQWSATKPGTRPL